MGESLSIKKNGPFFKEINKMKLQVKLYQDILDKK